MRTAMPAPPDDPPAIIGVRNAQGLNSQLAYLLAILGAQPARELIDHITSETRRP